MGGARRLLLGLLVTILAFVAVSGFAIWDDGGRFARTRSQHQPAPNGLAEASYLDARRFDWKMAEELHEYAREHRLELVDRIEGRRTP